MSKKHCLKKAKLKKENAGNVPFLVMTPILVWEYWSYFHNIFCYHMFQYVKWSRAGFKWYDQEAGRIQVFQKLNDKLK